MIALSRLGLVCGPALLVFACVTVADPEPSGSPRGGHAQFGGSQSRGGATSAGLGGTASAGRISAAAGGAQGSSGGARHAGGTTLGDAGDATTEAGGVPSTVPEDVIEKASVVLYYWPETTAPRTDRIFMRLFLENKSDKPLQLAQVSVRYWMTSEVSSPTVAHYYQGANINGETVRFVDAEPSYVEFTFSGRSIAQRADLAASEFQLQVTGGRFDQTNDFSFDAGHALGRAPHDKITVYVADRLVWGCDPSGHCAEQPASEGGAGGAAGNPGTESAGGGSDEAGGAWANGGAAGASDSPATAGAPSVGSGGTIVP